MSHMGSVLESSTANWPGSTRGLFLNNTSHSLNNTSEGGCLLFFFLNDVHGEAQQGYGAAPRGREQQERGEEGKWGSLC